MQIHRGATLRTLPLLALLLAVPSAPAQSGNAGTVRGTVTDPSGAVVPSATVELTDAVSQFDRTVTTNDAGQFTMSNVPFNPYLVTVSAPGFATVGQNAEIRSSVGITLKIVLKVAARPAQTVTVEAGGDLLRTTPPFTPTWTATCSPRCRWKASLLLSARLSPDHARRCRRLQRPLSRPWRPCLQLLLRRRPVHHRPAEQGLLQPDSLERHSIH